MMKVKGLSAGVRGSAALSCLLLLPAPALAQVKEVPPMDMGLGGGAPIVGTALGAGQVPLQPVVPSLQPAGLAPASLLPSVQPVLGPSLGVSKASLQPAPLKTLSSGPGSEALAPGRTAGLQLRRAPASNPRQEPAGEVIPARGREAATVREQLQGLDAASSGIRASAGREGESGADEAASAGRRAFDQDSGRMGASAAGSVAAGETAAGPAAGAGLGAASALRSGLHAPAASAVREVLLSGRAAASGPAKGDPGAFRGYLARILEAMKRPSQALASGAAGYRRGDAAAVGKAQQALKAGLLEKSREAAAAAGVAADAVVTHGTTLRGFLGMLVTGGIESTNPHAGFSGESPAVWGARGLETGANYGAVRGVSKGQPGVAILLHNAAKPFKVTGGEMLDRPPLASEDFLAAVVTDGEATVVLDRAAIRALAASAEAWRRRASERAYQGNMSDFMEWEKIRDFLAPRN